MCQEVADRHHTDSVREPRKKLRQGIAVREALLFYEHHDRCRGERLRQRRQTGSCFGCVRPARVAIGQAECALVEDVALLGHEDLAGEEMLIVESRHEALDLRAAVADGRRLGRAARRKGNDKAGGGMKKEVTTVHDTDSFPCRSAKSRADEQRTQDTTKRLARQIDTDTRIQRVSFKT